MPLPIPDILEKASAVLKLAHDLPYNPTNEDVGKVKHAAKAVSPNDLLAVLNEVGAVYTGMNHMQVVQMGSQPNAKVKALNVVIVVDYGMGPKQLVTALPLDVAKDLIKNLSDNLAASEGAVSGFISDASAVIGG